MSAPHRDLRVRLQRDALTTPWGLRLQGGKDFKAPLAVQRVFVGSPADGELHRGDVITSIENQDTSGLTHKQAQDLIKGAGGQLMLGVRRGVPRGTELLTPVTPPAPKQQGAYRSRPLDTYAPKPAPKLPQTFVPKPAEPMYGQQNFGSDYSRPSRGYGGAPQRAPAAPGGMLNKVNTSLNQAIWTPGQADFDQQGDPDYAARPVGEIKQMFGGGRQRAPPASAGGHKAKGWKKPAPHNIPGAGLADPGWSPGMPSHQGPAQQKPAWSPVRPPAGGGGPPLPVNRPQPVQQAQPAQAPQNLGYDERPAWMGSLKSAGGAKPWEVHAAADAAGVAQPPAAQQTQGRPAPAVQPHQPRVQNVHYGPGDSAPRYEQHDPAAGDHKNAVAVHAQYNSPLALYSKGNVQDAIDAQTGGKPGEGTIHVTGGGQPGKVDFRQSDVARMIAEEEGRHQKPRGYGLRPEQSARYEEQTPGEEIQYQGYQDHSRQSQSFRALEANMATQGEDVGASDF